MLAAARVMAGLAVRELADAADVNKQTISNLEGRDVIEVTPLRRHGYTSADVWGRIVGVLAAHGVELLPAGDDHGAGVRLARPRA